MNRKPRITVTNSHGTFEASPHAVDAAMEKYLPASVTCLREHVAEVYGYGAGHEYADDVHSVSELLVMLAEAIQTRWDSEDEDIESFSEHIESFFSEDVPDFSYLREETGPSDFEDPQSLMQEDEERRQDK